MNKKVLTRIIILLVVAGIVLIWVLSYNKYNKIQEIKENYQSLPEFNFYSFDNDTLLPASLKEDMYTVILFFDPHCDYCALELNALEKDIEKFEGVQIALISPVVVDTLRLYKKQFDFTAMQDVDMYYAEEEYLVKKFRNFGVPSTFIYDPDNKLIQEFLGFTKTHDILEVLKPETNTETTN